MKGNFENLEEGAVYRLNGREYYAAYNDGIWELRTLATSQLSYLILPSGEVRSARITRPTGLTINDLEFVRKAT